MLILLPLFPRRDLDAVPGLEPAMADAIPIFGQYALAADVPGGKPLGVISYVLAGVSLVACAVLLVALTSRLLRRETIIFGR